MNSHFKQTPPFQKSYVRKVMRGLKNIRIALAKVHDNPSDHDAAIEIRGIAGAISELAMIHGYHGVESIAGLGATFTTIHAYPKAMRAAVRARGALPLGLLGVSVLTSMDDDDLAAAGYRSDVTSLVASRAADAGQAGMDGLVCSAREAAQVRRAAGPNLLLVTPGIRPAGSDAGDQKRTLTPGEAIANGSDYLVVGRPIAAADVPAKAAEAIIAEIEAAL